MTIHDELRKQYIEENKKLGIDKREFAFNLSLGYVNWLERKIKEMNDFQLLLINKDKSNNNEMEKKIQIGLTNFLLEANKKNDNQTIILLNVFLNTLSYIEKVQALQKLFGGCNQINIVTKHKSDSDEMLD
jgi:hypothetical protein